MKIKKKIKKLLKETRPVDEVLYELSNSKTDFDKDPKFVADFLKSQFVEDIYKQMKKRKITKNSLAQKLGKSRQYINRILKEDESIDFTIEEMAAISCALNMELKIRLTERER